MDSEVVVKCSAQPVDGVAEPGGNTCLLVLASSRVQRSRPPVEGGGNLLPGAIPGACRPRGGLLASETPNLALSTNSGGYLSTSLLDDGYQKQLGIPCTQGKPNFKKHNVIS